MNRYAFAVLVLLAVPGFCGGDSYERLLKEYKKEIKAKAGDLENLTSEINQRREEMEQYGRKEDTLKKELDNLNSELNKIGTSIESTKKEIKNINNKLGNTARQLQASSSEITQWKYSLNRELDSLYREYYSADRVFVDIWQEKALECSIKKVAENMLLAHMKKSECELLLKQYSDMQAELLNEKKRVAGIFNEQKQAFDRRNRELKDVKKSKGAVVDEMKKLNNTASDLKKLISGLEDKKQKTQELKQEEELARKKFGEKKSNLPWPVRGDLASGFGKVKHPALDTYIISNGIKIKSAANEQVRAVDKGEVVYADDFRSYGKTVILSHGGGFYSIYGQLDEILVSGGKKVKSLEPVGKLGAKNNVLYFEIRCDNQPLDPIEWLEKKK